jgi:HNH endonuclease
MSTRPNLRLMTAEHVRPVWDGGRTVAGNVVAACYECNHARSGVFNQSKRGSRRFVIGDDTPSSPFAVLGTLLRLDGA